MPTAVNRLRRTAGLCLLPLLGAACGSPAPAERPREVRRCTLARESGDSLQQAVRCAEEFVMVNGYTAVPTEADPAVITPELNELVPSLGVLLRARRNTLFPGAIGVCIGRAPSGREPGFSVIFARQRGSPLDPRPPERMQRGRAVTMSLLYSDLRMEAEDLDVNGPDGPSCHRVLRE